MRSILTNLAGLKPDLLKVFTGLVSPYLDFDVCSNEDETDTQWSYSYIKAGWEFILRGDYTHKKPRASPDPKGHRIKCMECQSLRVTYVLMPLGLYWPSFETMPVGV